MFKSSLFVQQAYQFFQIWQKVTEWFSTLTYDFQLVIHTPLTLPSIRHLLSQTHQISQFLNHLWLKQSSLHHVIRQKVEIRDICELYEAGLKQRRWRTRITSYVWVKPMKDNPVDCDSIFLSFSASRSLTFRLLLSLLVTTDNSFSHPRWRRRHLELIARKDRIVLNIHTHYIGMNLFVVSQIADHVQWLQR